MSAKLDDDTGTSQTVRAQLKLRELIVNGELKAGSRIAELTLVDLLGASRTPIRMALVRLQEEGLLEALPNGGFAVKDFSEADIHDAIEVRGTLEAFAVDGGAPADWAREWLHDSEFHVAEDESGSFLKVLSEAWLEPGTTAADEADEASGDD